MLFIHDTFEIQAYYKDIVDTHYMKIYKNTRIMQISHKKTK